MRIASLLTAALISSQATAWADTSAINPDPIPTPHTAIVVDEHPVLHSAKAAGKLPFLFGKALVVNSYQSVRHPKKSAKVAAKHIDHGVKWLNEKVAPYTGAVSVVSSLANIGMTAAKVTGH